MSLQETWDQFINEKNCFENKLDACFHESFGDDWDYDKLGHDPYDNSVEIYGASNDLRLSEKAQLLFRDEGFSKVYVNHKDGWQTHYSGLLSDEFKPVNGWRRKAREGGGWLVSSFPNSWPKAWLENGSVEVVLVTTTQPAEAVGRDG